MDDLNAKIDLGNAAIAWQLNCETVTIPNYETVIQQHIDAKEALEAAGIKYRGEVQAKSQGHAITTMNWWLLHVTMVPVRNCIRRWAGAAVGELLRVKVAELQREVNLASGSLHRRLVPVQDSLPRKKSSTLQKRLSHGHV